jgi:type VI secretion system protein ImpG
MVDETVRIPAGVELASVPVDGTPCRFRTCQALDVHPLTLADIGLQNSAGAAPMLILTFELHNMPLAQWDADSIRLFLGSGYSEAAKLMLLLCNHVDAVHIVNAEGERCDLGKQALRMSGFDSELLPTPSHAFGGYRHIQEFFVQPEKFLFIDIAGLQRWTRRGDSHRFSVHLSLDQLPDWMPEIRSDSFQLHVTPAINLFPHAADPIAHAHKVTEYRVAPEGGNRQHYQVYAVDSVIGYRQGAVNERRYLPFGMMQHDGLGAKAGVCATVCATFRTTLRAATVGHGNELFLSVTYPPGEIPLPETLSLRITCTNRALPESLKLGDLNQPTDSSPERLSFHNIRAITPALNPPAGEALLWRLISHVSLNFLSVASAANLQSLLSLYVFSERQEQGQEIINRRRIEGIQDVAAVAETRLIGRGSLLRGQRVAITCRADHFAGIGDMYLFGCVLERFIADYAGINSYTRVELIDAFSGAVFKWPPRLGQQPLL